MNDRLTLTIETITVYGFQINSNNFISAEFTIYIII